MGLLSLGAFVFGAFVSWGFCLWDFYPWSFCPWGFCLWGFCSAFYLITDTYFFFFRCSTRSNKINGLQKECCVSEKQFYINRPFLHYNGMQSLEKKTDFFCNWWFYRYSDGKRNYFFKSSVDSKVIVNSVFICTSNFRYFLINR